MITLEFLEGIKDELIPGTEIGMIIQSQKINGKSVSKKETGCFHSITTEDSQTYIKYYGEKAGAISNFSPITRNIKDIECLRIYTK